MTGEKKSSDLSSRLGVKRSKTTPGKSPKSPTPAISAPPKAAIATAKRFNDMLHPRSSKERDRGRAASPCREEDGETTTHSLDEGRSSQDGITDHGAAKRIADLERSLATAREEQNTMREELAKLREHGLVYRETIEDYRRQLAGTYQQIQSPPGAFFPDSRPESARSNSYDGELTPRRSLNQPRNELVGQNDDLRAKIAQLHDQLMTQEATYQSLFEQGKLRNEVEWEELTARLHATEKESQERLQQLLSLKSSISSLTRIESQVTDSELSETLSQLGNRVREWTVSNFRRTKLDLSNVPLATAKELTAVSPTYEQVGPSDRLALFQALVANAMMRIFNEPIIVGLPQTGPLAPLRHVATVIYGSGAEYRSWRHATIRSLQKCEAKYSLQEEKEKQMHRLAADVIHHLFVLTSATLPIDAQSALESILNATADFQNTLLLQKAQYKMQFFRKQGNAETGFDDNRMESINELDEFVDEEGDTVVHRAFSFCIFPCLEKFGDEYGNHAEVSNVLVKARVCCSVG
ncbi:hypothetical protein N0V90_005772 [Kalmusia sp. IMI 367209]|nr:hypothetical protein N0V90_005772 [Kalmusia sp. IMI 367209]